MDVYLLIGRFPGSRLWLAGKILAGGMKNEMNIIEYVSPIFGNLVSLVHTAVTYQDLSSLWGSLNWRVNSRWRRR
jgi:hypothetical protein